MTVPLMNCPCGCGWTKHVIFNRFSVGEMDEARERKRARVRVHGIVTKAKRCGVIAAPLACENCGEEGPVQGHHEDYSKPLELIWLCPPCHAVADDARREREAEERSNAEERARRANEKAGRRKAA